MGVVAVKIKIMPSSPEINIEELKDRIKKFLEERDVKKPQFEIQPIAFGLKALIAMFGWPEEKGLEGLEEAMGKIQDVNSVDLLDIRRAVG